ncbi:MAG: CDC27 family protein [Candidatus Nitrosoabyssus spongiisocia]|nr:MAG: CDC27 family protein [Nitrosopumilaceae archaeon AB1(1)]
MKFFHYPKRNLRKLITKGEYNSAVTLAHELLEKDPYDTDVLFILAGAYYILEDAPSVLRYVDKILEITNSDVEAIMLKATALVALGKTKEAINCCKIILKEQPYNRSAKTMMEKLE